MTTNFSDDLPTDAVELMRERLLPGERMLLPMRLMVEGDRAPTPACFAITNQRLYAFEFNRPLFSRPIVIDFIDFRF
jgi:hypothetical protein